MSKMTNQLPGRKEALNPKFNPKSSYREGQLGAVVSCFGAIHNGYKYIALNAETGSGKTIIAGSLANLVGSSYICTTRIKLQDQYLDLGPDFKKTDGRGNHVCVSSGRHKACSKGMCVSGPEDFVCDYKPTSKGIFEGFNNKRWHNYDKRERCEYWKNVEVGVNARHTVLNYPYFILKMNSPYNDFGRRPLLVLDEGHNIEDYVRGISKVVINNRTLNPIHYDTEVDSEEYKGLETIPIGILKTTGQIYDWLVSLRSILDIRYSETQLSIDAGVKGLSRRLSLIESLKNKIEKFILSYEINPDNWVSISDGNRVEIVPLYIGDYFNKYVAAHADIILIMSATLPSKETLCKRLGINRDEMFYYTVDSTFPPENAPIYSHPQPVMNYVEGQMEAKRNKMGAAILKLLRNYDGKRGLILCNSYSEMRHYIDFIKDNDPEVCSRLSVHDRDTKIEYVLEDHMERLDSVIVSASSWEGLDLPGELAEFEIIVKVPYSDMSSVVVRGLKNIDSKRYFEDACIKIRQGTGRVVRSPEDKAEINIMDGAFRNLYRYNKNEFPESFKERIILV